MKRSALYNSQWNEMLWVICESATGHHWCYSNYLCNLDDGQTWAEGSLNTTQLDHLNKYYTIFW